ncbi:hypothetical protein GCM10010521_72220 [Streptomyces rameus]|uniref:Uncharacterized protein n=1 Tax=Streptomyces rameus TaxID=68261 RepID=A0ABP6HT25_9ACTN
MIVLVIIFMIVLATPGPDLCSALAATGGLSAAILKAGDVVRRPGGTRADRPRRGRRHPSRVGPSADGAGLDPTGRTSMAYPVPLPFRVVLWPAFPQHHLPVRASGRVPDDVLREPVGSRRPRRPADVGVTCDDNPRRS